MTAKTKEVDVAAETAAADAEFREAVSAAATKRAKRLEGLPTGTSIAERAWNATKDPSDPDYGSCAIEHRQKLDTAVSVIKATGTAGIVGLEAFEAKVKELLEAEKPSTAVVLAEPAKKGKE